MKHSHSFLIYYVNIYLVVFSAADDIPHADEVRTLIKDIWDLRIAKLRKSIDIMVSQQEVYARVSRISTGYVTYFIKIKAELHCVEMRFDQNHCLLVFP